MRKTKSGTGPETDIGTETGIERGRKSRTDIGTETGNETRTETRTEIPAHPNTRRRRSSHLLQRITRRTANCTVSAKHPMTSQSKFYRKTSPAHCTLN